MNDRTMVQFRAPASVALMAAFALIAAVGAGNAQTMQPQYAPPPPPPPQARYMPPQPVWYVAARPSIASNSSACGGDFGMLGKIELERRDLSGTPIDTAQYCK